MAAQMTITKLQRERAKSEKQHNKAIRTAFYAIFEKVERDTEVARLTAERDTALAAIDTQIAALSAPVVTRKPMTDAEFIAWVNSFEDDAAPVVTLTAEQEPVLTRCNEQRYEFTNAEGMRGVAEWGDGYWYAYQRGFHRDQTLHTGATPQEAAEDAIRAWVAMDTELAA